MPFQPAGFDREAIEQHGITPQDIENARRYVAILQGVDSLAYADMAAGCYYGTSALLHEVIEVRILLERDRLLLKRSRQEVSQFLQENEDAHVQGLMVEYHYLQRVIKKHLGEEVGLAALVRANTILFDYDRLLEFELPLPLFEPTPARIARAEGLLSRLRELGKEAKPC